MGFKRKLLVPFAFATLALQACSKPAPEVDIFDAARDGNLDSVQQSIKAGRDLNKRGPLGKTPLMIAIVNEHFDIAKELINAKADVNIVDDRKWSALHLAAASSAQGNLEMVMALVDANAKINVRNSDQTTPYHMALLYRNKPSAEYLKSKGADTKIVPLKPTPRSSPMAG